MNSVCTTTVVERNEGGNAHIMPAFQCSVKKYNDPKRPSCKWIVRYNHPTKGLKRAFFSTREEADTHKIEVETDIINFGTKALDLSGTERIEALDAMERIRPFGVRLCVVVDEWLARRRYASHTVNDLCDVYIASKAKADRSKKHMQGLTCVLGRFRKSLGSRIVSTLTEDDIADWIEGEASSAANRNYFRIILNGALNFAVAKRYCNENLVENIEVRKVKSAPVGILTVNQMEGLLQAARKEVDVFASIALGGFAGIRPEEIARLKWHAISLNQIDISADICKTAKHRFVKVEDTLGLVLLEADALNRKGLIQGPNYRRRFDEVRRNAGFAVWPSKEGVEWPHDALRHSFASYHLAHFKDAARTALELGHSDTKMLFANYRARVSETDAAKWWSISTK